MNNALRNYS